MPPITAPPPLPPLRRLLDQPGLRLRLLTPEPALPARALEQSVEWVHSSDLADPTPFLSAGQVLLTTGTQFTGEDATEAFYDEYVSRLCSRGITALGFGTEVVRDGTPDPLVAACLAHGLPLVEVPYSTPFIAVARAAGDLVAELRYARHTWALGAQRAISRAALRPDGLSATLSELSRQLNHWVALFDASGALDRVFPRDTFSGAGATNSRGSLSRVQREAARLLHRGQRASTTLDEGGETLTLQTLGRRDQLRGVLALGGASELDQASQEVVTSVIAMAGLALEQNSALDRARGHLRSGLLHALLGGDVELAQTISREMWGPLPPEPVRIAIVEPLPERLDALTEFLELRVEERPGQLFFARDGRSVMLCVDQAGGPLLDELVGFGLHVGVSDRGGYRALPHLVAQARQALERSNEGSPGIVEFEVISRQGVLAFLARTDASEVGRATLQPLSDHDAAHGTVLLPTLRVWLEQNGQFGPAATELGVHRHTVRGRIDQAEALLGRDLATFHARADLWAALLAAGDAPL
ncbi:MAG: PucR family transcriptional regulator [Ramlibacter sp.]|nr:PucR family transcriptional regulator [Cryobacterium sp.]